ncbi:MAG: cytochrome c [Brucellaceae bacterium]|nr:cytochrome c [Brucellaceae bacterium]
MKRLLLAFSVVAMAAGSAFAADDPIAVRKSLMQSNGAVVGVAAAMMKQELDYNPAVAKAAIAALHGVAMAYGDFFPEGSETGGNTTASPKIWEDAAGFSAAVAKFQADTGAAMQASGREGPADLAAFQAAVGPVLSNCQSCHQSFRVQN